MFGTLGGPELFLILVIALIVFGPRKLPEMGKSLGRMLAEFRRASNEFKRTIEDEVEAEKAREQPAPAPPLYPAVAAGAEPAAAAETTPAVEPALAPPPGTVPVAPAPDDAPSPDAAEANSLRRSGERGSWGSATEALPPEINSEPPR
jgi:TatA/E family protein of Tat protein translocase